MSENLENGNSRQHRDDDTGATHKFKLGQTVFLDPISPYRHAPPGAYEVTKQMPERSGEFEYQVKSSAERHERVVRESALSGE